MTYKIIAISIEEEDFVKLQDMVDYNDAANISHAVRKTIRAYPFHPMGKKAD